MALQSGIHGCQSSGDSRLETRPLRRCFSLSTVVKRHNVRTCMKMPTNREPSHLRARKENCTAQLFPVCVAECFNCGLRDAGHRFDAAAWMAADADARSNPKPRAKPTRSVEAIIKIAARAEACDTRATPSPHELIDSVEGLAHCVEVLSKRRVLAVFSCNSA